MPGEFTPIGSADQSTDVTRQSSVAAWFNSVENILAGVDDQPRVAYATDGAQVLGFGSAFGADVGIGNNGEIYIRGRTGQVGTDDATKGKPASEGFKFPPGMLLFCAVVALVLIAR